MDHLWAPWRLPYVTGLTADKGTTACVFCVAPTQSDEASLIVHRASHVYAILNRFPYNNGHLMVMPYRHVPALTDLSRDELHDLVERVQEAEEVLTAVYAPQGINVGINLGLSAGAGLRDHLHVHLVPRWNGDTNFISVLGETRVLSEDMLVTAARLRSAWSTR